MSTSVQDDRLDSALAALPVIGILRGHHGDHLVAAGELLAAEGIRVIEIPLTTPRALEAVTKLSESLGADVVVGAGTVLDEDDARRSIEAGAQLLVSPALCPQALQYGRTHGVATLPGTYTPSEMLTALELGARLVKLFPADTLGPGYLRNVRAPLPNLRAVPTGGVDLESAADWLRAGAAGLGLGTPLVRDTLESGDLDALRRSTREWVAAVRTAS